jgi:DNA-binding IclR family transcriptional regulator
VQLGIRLWELLNRNSPTLELRQAAMPFMEDIQQVLNQNVTLAVLDGWEALFVERLSRRGSVANRAQVAGRMPVHVSSAGLVLMANQPGAVQAEYLGGFADPAGRVSADELRVRLAEAAHQGYAELAGEPSAQEATLPEELFDCLPGPVQKFIDRCFHRTWERSCLQAWHRPLVIRGKEVRVS